MEKKDLKIVFMGTPDFAVATLRRLVEGGYRVVGVVTQPDKPVGRHGSVLQAPAVKQYALAAGLPVLQPEKMKDPVFLEQLRALDADLQVVVAFRMLPEAVWAMPRFGTFNVHAALLPQYRGAAPINWAIINGETLTGVTTFFLDHDIDTGRIILQRPFDIPDDADAQYVYNGLMALGAEAATDTIDRMLQGDGRIASMAQEEIMQRAGDQALRSAPKLFKETCQIDWSLPPRQVYNFIRGLSPIPGAWTPVTAPDGTQAVLKIFRSRLAETVAEGFVANRGRLFLNGLELLDVQLSGKRRMAVRDFLNGCRDIESYRIGG